MESDRYTPYIDTALSALASRQRLLSELVVGGDDALAALAIVLIGAGYEHTHIVKFVENLMGTDWALKMDHVLCRGNDASYRPWLRKGDVYMLVRKPEPLPPVEIP